MKVILNGLEQQNKPSKVIIFILWGYYGFDQALIVKFFSLPWTCVDYEHCYFELEGKKYPMVEKLAKQLKEKQREYKEKGVKPTAKDEVSYLTNATVSQILRYVPEDVIEKMV